MDFAVFTIDKIICALAFATLEATIFFQKATKFENIL